ncbi:MAG: energy-coupling factor ABC transporter ATP-binding protein [Firmicutes bacterium]|nr:energy-coupling factor ABC transporter ATP-binding protein [Bacillota bacterium]
MIEIKNLSVQFKNISFNYQDKVFHKNGITFITGRNGTGKTTLLKALSRLIPFSGEIKVDGLITYNAQEPILFNKTVFENIVYPLRIRKLNISEYEEKILEYARLLDLEHLLNESSLKLSSGEKMKVSIIRSIIFHPDVVLLDEPTTHLDLESIQELTSLLKILKHDMTFIIVSHNQTFMNELQSDVYSLGGSNVYREIN